MLALMESSAVVQAMQEPSFYGDDCAVEVRETHMSWVFLTGARAYKLKKPVVLPFVDYGTRERRRQMCHEEVRLNRRLAPRIYLGVRSVIGVHGRLMLSHADDPRAVEHVVEMRRFDERATLAAYLSAGAATGHEIDEIGRTIAHFHAAARRCALTDYADRFQSDLDDSLDALEAGGLRRFADGYIRTHRALLEGRGLYAVEGHADLRAEHVVLEVPLQIVDCVEFDARLRIRDPASDLAFLVMDLEANGRPDFAERLVRAYRDAGGSVPPEHLIAFYAMERALVRAKVDQIRASQLGSSAGLGDDAAARSDAKLALAKRLAWRARGPLAIAICGLSGSGKTFLADALAHRRGARVISSDVVRKELAAVPATEHAPPEAYSRAFSRQVYRELGRRAAAALADHEAPIVIDATARSAADRGELVAALDAPIVFARCVARPELLRERVRDRSHVRGSVSDADEAVLAAQSFEPLADAHSFELHTDRPPDAVLDELERALDASIAPRNQEVSHERHDEGRRLSRA